MNHRLTQTCSLHKKKLINYFITFDCCLLYVLYLYGSKYLVCSVLLDIFVGYLIYSSCNLLLGSRICVDYFKGFNVMLMGHRFSIIGLC